MKEFWFYLKFIWTYVRELKRNLIIYVCTHIIRVIISIIVPILSAQAIIHLTSNAWEQLILVAIVMYLLENARNVMHYFGNYNAQYLYRESFIRLQTALGRQIVQIENECMDSHSSGVFIQRLTNDTSKLADIFFLLNRSIANIITDVGILIAVFFLNKIVFIYIVSMLLIVYAVDSTRVQKRGEKDKIFREKNEKVSGFVGELVRGIRDIKMLNAEDSFMKELHFKVRDVNGARYDMGDVDRRYVFLRDLFYDLWDLLLILLLVFLVTHNGLAVATALIIYNYSGRIGSIISGVSTLLEGVKDFNLSASRVYAIIEGEEFPKEKFGTMHLDNIEGNFEFKNVTFHYGSDKKKVLNKINFKVNANETVAFVGKSGAGKTTIFSLLCKMYDVDSGHITIDGVDIKRLDKESIRGNITIISQNPYIFHMSIRDNLRLMKENLTEDEMVEACKLASFHDFVMKLPDGYDTVVGEGGVSLSGGQKQRLAIARAFVQKTEIILMDEATSALDNETQSNIQKAIENMKKEYTILIVAHRLSTVVNSDRILFVKDGKILAEGSHKELLKTCSDYRSLYETEMEK